MPHKGSKTPKYIGLEPYLMFLAMQGLALYLNSLLEGGVTFTTFVERLLSLCFEPVKLGLKIVRQGDSS